MLDVDENRVPRRVCAARHRAMPTRRTIMEIRLATHSIVRFGLEDCCAYDHARAGLLPVCVTPVALIDAAGRWRSPE
jgi:hypothetical protein